MEKDIVIKMGQLSIRIGALYVCVFWCVLQKLLNHCLETTYTYYNSTHSMLCFMYVDIKSW
jgi:hypothetical protein